VTALITAGAGFLLAVLWFDLMFDVQVLQQPAGELPEDVLASIAGYYRRVTTDARPMNRLVAAVMLITLASIAAQIGEGDAPAWAAWASLGLAGTAVATAAAHTVPAAVRLGARTGPAAVQSRLARSICRDHLFCITAIMSLIAIQLVFAT
jgi:ER membrane protein SH3